MPHPPGGKVNAANLNFLGLNDLSVLLGTETIAIQPADGGPLEGILVSQLPGGGGGVTVEDEGVPLATVADTLDFTGAVTASGAGTTKTINIPGTPDPLLLSDGVAADPTYSFLAESTLGIYRHAVGRLGWAGDTFRPTLTSGPGLRNIGATATNPNINPNASDTNTGLGGAVALDEFSLVAGGVNVARCTEVAGVVQFVLPIQNNAGEPSLAFGILADDGLYQNTAGQISVALTGVQRWIFEAGEFRSALGGASANIKNAAATGTLPNYTFSNDDDTGMGRTGSDVGTLIAGGVNVMEFGEAGAAPLMGFFTTAAVAKPTGVAVTAAGIHAALVTLGLIAA